MPLKKKTYSFKSKGENVEEYLGREYKSGQEGVSATPISEGTPSSKIKTRGRSFIGWKTPTGEHPALGFDSSSSTRNSVRLRSFRKRKMEDRHEEQSDNKGQNGKSNKMQKVEPAQEEIQRRIDDQIRMREGALKLQSACSNVKQAVDASKNLLTINARVLALMSALQKSRSTTVLREHNRQQSREDVKDIARKPCVAELGISDIRIPLMWKDDAHYKGKAGEPQTLLYFMFCLLKLGDQVYDTPLKQIDCIDTDVTFGDPLIFHDVDADFKVELEVYYTVLVNPDNYTFTPMRTPKKAGLSACRPKYCLVAHSQFTVDDLKGGFVTADFTMGSKGASGTAVLGHIDELPEHYLELWGQFSCQLGARPTCMTTDSMQGNLYVQTVSSGQSLLQQYSSRLKECCLQCWQDSLDSTECIEKCPDIKISIKSSMKVCDGESNGLSKKHVLILTSNGAEKEPVLAFDSIEEQKKWKAALEQAIVDVRAWKTACDSLMVIKKSELKRLSFNPNLPFYEQISVDLSDLKPKTPLKTPDYYLKLSLLDEDSKDEGKADNTQTDTEKSPTEEEKSYEKVCETGSETTDIHNIQTESNIPKVEVGVDNCAFKEKTDEDESLTDDKIEEAVGALDEALNIELLSNSGSDSGTESMNEEKFAEESQQEEDSKASVTSEVKSAKIHTTV